VKLKGRINLSQDDYLNMLDLNLKRVVRVSIIGIVDGFKATHLPEKTLQKLEKLTAPEALMFPVIGEFLACCIQHMMDVQATGAIDITPFVKVYQAHCSITLGLDH